MPGKKHVRGVGEKKQRQYEHIVDSAQREGRYGKRAKEVAATDSSEAAQESWTLQRRIELANQKRVGEESKSWTQNMQN
jgi:hypothetical protein